MRKIICSMGIIVLVIGAFFSSHLFLPAKILQFGFIHIGSSPIINESRMLGRVASSEPLSMSVDLSIPHPEQLDEFLHELNDPSSPKYHHYLTPEEFGQRFGPSIDDQQKVINYLTRQRFKITQTYANHRLISFSGSESQVEQAFNTPVNKYQSSKGDEFFSNITAPSLPADLASSVISINGLNNIDIFAQSAADFHADKTDSKSIQGCPDPDMKIPGFPGIKGYSPDQFAQAYDYFGLYRQGLFGERQRVALLTPGGRYLPDDIRGYLKCYGFGRPNVSSSYVDKVMRDVINPVSVNSFTNANPSTSWTGTDLDLEMQMEAILGMAPNLEKLIIYQSPRDLLSINKAWEQIIAEKGQNRASVISVSTGTCEQPGITDTWQRVEEINFKEAEAQRQTILAAAGNSGSSGCLPITKSTSPAVTDPAAQPLVTAIGGTSLHVVNNNYQSETVWNNGRNAPPNGMPDGAGGGGYSRFFARPSWQHGVLGVDDNRYAKSLMQREVPDVSLDADPLTGYQTFCTLLGQCTNTPGGGGWLVTSGTSIAAPMWAAGIALFNEKAARAGKGPIGFLNAKLYTIASGSRATEDFHAIPSPTARECDSSLLPANNDILYYQMHLRTVNGVVGYYRTVQTQPPSPNKGYYPVTNTRYNMATGLGSFDAANLAEDMVALL